MRQLRGIYSNGSITFIDEPPYGLISEVLVTFLDSDVLSRIRRRDKFFSNVTSPVDPSYVLTERDLEILQMVSDGLTAGEISEIVFYRPVWVRWVLYGIYGKLKVRSKIQAIKKAVDLGFLPKVECSQAAIDEFGNRKLFEKDIEVLQLIYEGYSRDEICEKLGLGYKELTKINISINKSLEVRNRIEAIRRGLEIGIIKPSTRSIGVSTLELSTDEVISTYRSEMERVHGKEYADAMIVEHRHRWFYVSHPTLQGNQFVVNPHTKALRRYQMMELIDKLRDESSSK